MPIHIVAASWYKEIEPMTVRTLMKWMMFAAAMAGPAAVTTRARTVSGQEKGPEMTEKRREKNEPVIFDFRQGTDLELWDNVDDVVMGGVSRSTMRFEDGRAVFAGTVSLEDRGGFASVRSRPKDHDLSEYDGIAVRVRGDGKRYNVRLRTTRSFDDVSYRAEVEPQEGRWTELKLPFAIFEPTYRGREMPDYGDLDPGEIKMFGLLISGKQQGPFRLEIEWVKGYKEPCFLAPGGTGNVTDYRGKRRLLLVFAASAQDTRLKQQQTWISENAAGFRDRDMVALVLTGFDTSAGKTLRANYGLEKDAFGVVLIGKDGGEKFRSNEPSKMEGLFSLIDAMPMRRQEMKVKER